MNILLLLPRVMQKDIHFTYKSKFTTQNNLKVEIILNYFRIMTEEQRKQFAAL